MAASKGTNVKKASASKPAQGALAQVMDGGNVDQSKNRNNAGDQWDQNVDWSGTGTLRTVKRKQEVETYQIRCRKVEMNDFKDLNQKLLDDVVPAIFGERTWMSREDVNDFFNALICVNEEIIKKIQPVRPQRYQPSREPSHPYHTSRMYQHRQGLQHRVNPRGVRNHADSSQQTPSTPRIQNAMLVINPIMMLNGVQQLGPNNTASGGAAPMAVAQEAWTQS